MSGIRGVSRLWRSLAAGFLLSAIGLPGHGDPEYGEAAARTEEAVIAVATNFAEVMEALEADFERASGHRLTVVSGSTGKLYAQIRHGAPFDVLMAADQHRPERLVNEGTAVPGTGFTYATGRLVLWSADPDRLRAGGVEALTAGDFRHLAMANPDLAPYGAAAREVLRALGLEEALEARIVMGENIGQAHALVATGNAELGFIALSYVASSRNARPGSRWEVPASLHAPIRQDVVLLERGENNSAARDFLAYLRRPEVQQRIRAFGYDVE